MSGVLSKTGSAAVTALLKSKASVAQIVSAVGKGDPKKTEDAIRQLQYQLDIQTQIILALATGSDSLSVLGAGGEVVGWIGSDADKVGAWFKTLYVGGTGPSDAPFYSDENGDVTVASLSVWAPSVDVLTLTDNSPGAGRIAWAACNLYFAGTTYSIASGNTSSSTHKHVYWVRGASTFSSAVEMPADVDNYLIATNTLGVADIAIGKVGAGKSITEESLVPSLLKGMSGPNSASASITMTGLGTTTVLNVTSGGGVITAIYVVVTTAVLFSGSSIAQLKMQIDGEAEVVYPLYPTGASTASELWNAISDNRNGDMSNVGDYRLMSSSVQFPFAESASVKITVGTNAYTTGVISVFVTYGLKTDL